MDRSKCILRSSAGAPLISTSVVLRCLAQSQQPLYKLSLRASHDHTTARTYTKTIARERGKQTASEMFCRERDRERERQTERQRESATHAQRERERKKTDPHRLTQRGLAPLTSRPCTRPLPARDPHCARVRRCCHGRRACVRRWPTACGVVREPAMSTRSGHAVDTRARRG